MVAFGLAVIGFASTAMADSPGWITTCPYSHSKSDDPIKFPNTPGASHLHDFFGSKTTNAASTYDSMLASATTCGSPADKSGYWIPALYKDGVKVDPDGAFHGRKTREKFYYRNNAYKRGTVVEPFPANFRMIQGYHDATSVEDANLHGASWGREMYWGCSDNSGPSKPTAPIDCDTGIITLHVGFPSCWDGVLVPGDEIASGHMRFPKSGVCPAGFSHALPRLLERFEWPIGTVSTGITFSSGPYYTANADFWNVWDQATLNSLVTECLNGDDDCGSDP